MVMVIVEVRICQMLCQLASRHWLCGHAGIYAGLIKGQAGRKDANMPIFGRIGTSFSPWQSQFGETSTIREIWKFGRAVYDSLGIFCHAAV